ncbi:MAG: phosphatidylglycerophosphatase A [Acidobacteria bacterium]|nr:phosphatidylglycerophosphatase A [Acidobacteriota bacterium]
MSESTSYKAPRWAWWVATGFGSGYLKPAPGTWGSFVAALVWLGLQRLAVHRLPGADLLTGWLAYGILPAMALTWISIRASDAVATETGTKDPSFIVADEWAGQWFAMAPLWLLVPIKGPMPILAAWALIPFLAFRLFDVWKPGLIDDLQSLPGGKGIVMDDVLAGLYAGTLTALVLFLLRP